MENKELLISELLQEARFTTPPGAFLDLTEEEIRQLNESWIEPDDTISGSVKSKMQIYAEENAMGSAQAGELLIHAGSHSKLPIPFDNKALEAIGIEPGDTKEQVVQKLKNAITGLDDGTTMAKLFRIFVEYQLYEMTDNEIPHGRSMIRRCLDEILQWAGE